MHTIKNITPILLFSAVIFISTGCENTGFGQRADDLFLVTANQQYFYDIKKPDDKHFLPYVLEEISALSLGPDQSLLAVDDETGKVFVYDLQKRDITHSIKFYKGDDFEGIELVDEVIYILRSDGDLFKVDYTTVKESRAWEIETKLGKKNDTEGLGYDPLTNRLLIACKEKGSLDKEDVKGRAIYGFDLGKNELDEVPLFTIKIKDLIRFWETNKEFEYDKDRIKFKPSAIAFNPISKDYYVLSSVGKLLVVVNPEGDIKATYPIYPQILGQPEGLTFAENGDMYISSEGEGDRGYILRFEMKSK